MMAFLLALWTVVALIFGWNLHEWWHHPETRYAAREIRRRLRRVGEGVRAAARRFR